MTEQDNANYLLPYTGAGSGVRRALEYDPNAVFYNDIGDSREITHAANEFVITIPRNSNQAQPESNSVTRKLTKKEEDIRNFCSVPRTAQEIMDRIGISNQSKNRQKYITALILSKAWLMSRASRLFPFSLLPFT
ncbi:hypothetical protein [Parabacteroides sp. ZJ-118]|uniref:hypothetical protein n=1 Tax=Parabacteroides sp. ZJ-118 TaxID=2709398 RepID=UPI001F14C8BF|nr:hypothetical protein [Parabacteroides sp. ZJ-118]